MLTWIFDIGLLVVVAWVVWIWRKTVYVPKTRNVCVLAWDSGQGVEILGATPSTLDATRGDEIFWDCLLYTSDAADDLLCVDLGGRRIIKKKKKVTKEKSEYS